jgi:LysR family hydrogen peroxide-inducible transcriptional activator
MTPLPTLRQLRYLTALADHGHFGRAADACLVTQSTLSAGLQELETLLGAMLVERTKRRVMLTPLGEDVVRRARRLLADAQDLVDVVRAAEEPLSGPLRLGVIPTIAPYLLPTALPVIRSRHPGLRLSLREDLSGRLAAALQEGTLDVLLLALPWPIEGAETVAIGEDPFLLALLAGHPLAAAAVVDLGELPANDLLMLEEGHCLRDHALAACRLAGRWGGGVGLTGTSLNTIVHMVAGGMGLTLLPKMAVDAGVVVGAGLTVRPLADPEAKRIIGLAWRSSSPRGEEFRVLAAEFAAALEKVESEGGVQ